MHPLFLWIIILIVSLAALVKGSDWFTEAAEMLSSRLGVSSFLIGVTVVSVGTSLPELASSIAAVMAGASEIVAGNVIGSNIANTLLVLGTGAVIAGKLKAPWKTRKTDLSFLTGATILFALLIIDGQFVLFEALIMLVSYALYLWSMKDKHRHEKKEKGEPLRRILAPLLVAGVLIYVGASFTVQSVIGIATLTGISNGILAITVVAIGTSLPELAVTIAATWKGKGSLALGNIVGSNLFNILGVMGIAGLFGSLIIPTSLLIFAVPALLVATLIFWFVTRDTVIRRWEGWVLLSLYAFFVVRLFI